MLFSSVAALAQQTLKGKVVNANDGSPLIGVTVAVKGTTQGTITNEAGEFTIGNVKIPATLVFNSIGFENQSLAINSANEEIVVQLKESAAVLNDVVVVGSRFAQRTAMTTPVPVDVISSADLISSGQPTVDKMLTYRVPAYNSTQQTISDATAHFDPADLRGLGPSRTLVLINGKRKNASSLVYINDTPGKGEVGVDMKSIPAYAIERIEVLRDGASAQYGSDAIAGVINVILKKNVDYTTLNLFGGATSKGDGGSMGFNLNTGTSIGKNGGFLNITADYADQKETNRAGSPGQDELFGVMANDPTWGTWLKANPSLGMKVGQPNMTTRDVFYNLTLPLGEKGFELYSFGGLTYRKGKSYALYRTPYWVPDPYNIFHAAGTAYNGFGPSFETDIQDHTIAVGGRGESQGWKYDISVMNGANSVDYTVANSLNRSMGAASPTTFHPGGYSFASTVTNVDLGKQFSKLLLGLGTEFRTENFIAITGEEASYIGGGAQSFPGVQPSNAVNAKRYNVGFYLDLSYDITKDFLIGGTARHEKYSDFGNNFSWKINGRYKMLDDKLVIRASYSTGFRAPSLHQIYMSNVQTLLSGGTISNQGTFNNESAVVRSLGVEKLKAEEAQNFTAGITLNPTNKFNLAVDYYDIKVNNRIVYSSSIASSDTNTAVGKILKQYSVTIIKFFANAINTRSKGVDVVASYSNIALGSGKLGIMASANFNHNELDANITTPAPIAASNAELFDRKEQSRILTARPNSKIILGLNYNVGNLRVALNNTRFGSVKWQHVDNGLNAFLGHDDAYFDQVFAAKIITDLNLEYKFSKTIGATIAVNNLFNVYPDPIDAKGDFVTTLGGRFKYPWEVNQFGFNGTTFTGSLTIRF